MAADSDRISVHTLYRQEMGEETEYYQRFFQERFAVFVVLCFRQRRDPHYRLSGEAVRDREAPHRYLISRAVTKIDGPVSRTI